MEEEELKEFEYLLFSQGLLSPVPQIPLKSCHKSELEVLKVLIEELYLTQNAFQIVLSLAEMVRSFLRDSVS